MMNLYPVHDRVGRAVIQALQDAGIIVPYMKSRVSVEANPTEEEVPEMRVACH
jgi:hypothetical protein